MNHMKKLIVGNWKMNGNLTANQDLLVALAGNQNVASGACDAAVCAPVSYLFQLKNVLETTRWMWGAQDVSAHDAGAYTGEVSAGMLKDFNVRYVLVGHSERRQYHGESDSLVAAKAQRALAAGITPIVCVGETLAERERGETMDVVKRQLAAVIHAVGHCATELVVAYEPVWAIGTGQTASPPQAQAVHAVLRAQLVAACGEHGMSSRILYGGSMTAANAAALLAENDIDGGLIGGASLKPTDFSSILFAASAA
ncbi:MAG: triose-phosphate isomerase [Burkholderiaceae bacterium]|nr:triose-phosphate isomerase [Burkholderiaceae bacterium]